MVTVKWRKVKERHIRRIKNVRVSVLAWQDRMEDCFFDCWSAMYGENRFEALWEDDEWWKRAYVTYGAV